MHISSHIIVFGRVQGVFFRVNTKAKADELGLKGWVRNKNDGTVEILVEGDKKNIKDMINWCHKGPVYSNVEKVIVKYNDDLLNFDDFKIRY